MVRRFDREAGSPAARKRANRYGRFGIDRNPQNGRVFSGLFMLPGQFLENGIRLGYLFFG
jgi:hypothetical protein